MMITCYRIGFTECSQLYTHERLHSDIRPTRVAWTYIFVGIVRHLNRVAANFSLVRGHDFDAVGGTVDHVVAHHL